MIDETETEIVMAIEEANGGARDRQGTVARDHQDGSTRSIRTPRAGIIGHGNARTGTPGGSQETTGLGKGIEASEAIGAIEECRDGMLGVKTMADHLVAIETYLMATVAETLEGLREVTAMSLLCR